MKTLHKLVVLGSGSMLTLPAFAAFTGTDVAADITGNAAGLALVGGAILGVVYAVRAFSWAKKI